MEIHYFQRYYEKENVATANTMLLLKRLYIYSPDKFFKLLKNEFFPSELKPEIVFSLQEKNKDSVPDATISQNSFKIVIETKMSDCFSVNQLTNHLNSFQNETTSILITLAPNHMNKNTREAFDKELKKFNDSNNRNIIHINITFKQLIDSFKSILNERDYEMKNVIEDYTKYCYSSRLINYSNYMKVQLAKVTLDFNIKNNLYYDKINRSFGEYPYLGLYDEKCVKAIGKISDIIVAYPNDDGELTYEVEKGTLTEEKKQKIEFAIEEAKKFNYDLSEQRYFFVEKFYETKFKKVSRNPLRGSKLFDLAQILNVEVLPDTEQIAEQLETKTWS